MLGALPSLLLGNPCNLSVNETTERGGFSRANPSMRFCSAESISLFFTQFRKQMFRALFFQKLSFRSTEIIILRQRRIFD